MVVAAAAAAEASTWHGLQQQLEGTLSNGNTTNNNTSTAIRHYITLYYTVFQSVICVYQHCRFYTATIAIRYLILFVEIPLDNVKSSSSHSAAFTKQFA